MRLSKLYMLLCLLYCPLYFYPVTMTEMYIMLQRVWQNPHNIGGVAPLSSYVCEEIVSELATLSSGKPKCYLEVGAGCGTTTEFIVKHLRECDKLVLVEVDPEMCDFLRNRYQGYNNIQVCCESILDWKSSAHKYDAIISTLPFNSFDVLFAQKVFETFKKVARSGCKVSYVECPIVKQIGKYFFSCQRRQRFEEIQSFLDLKRKDLLIRSKVVYFNLPPIEIHHLYFI